MTYLILMIGFYIPIEFYIGVAIILTTILVFICLLIYKLLFKKITIWRLLKITFLTPIILILLSFIIYFAHDFISSPMTVRKHHLKGSFVINRDMFKGENADWQYDHYWLNIGDDTLYLHIMDNGNEIKEYKRPIKYIYPYHRGHSVRDHTFLSFLYSKLDLKFRGNSNEEKIIIESQNHHMLNHDPKLLAYPFNFNIVLVSDKYGNMYFIKGKWGERKNK